MIIDLSIIVLHT